MGSVQVEHQICGERAATGCPLREERLPSTQQCNYHARKPEMGDPCEQAGGSQARNVVPHYKQLSGRNNIRTHSRSHTHQREHTPLLTTTHPHRSLQTLLLSEHHQVMEQMHTTVNIDATRPTSLSLVWPVPLVPPFVSKSSKTKNDYQH